MNHEQKRIQCPTWLSPLFFITEQGIEVKCRSCRGMIHVFTKEQILQYWAELAQKQPEKVV